MAGRKNKDDKKGAGKHERTKTPWKRSHPKRATVSHIAADILYTAKFSNEKQRALCYFWDDGDARFGREGPLGLLPNPFSGMCDLSLPAD